MRNKRGSITIQALCMLSLGCSLFLVGCSADEGLDTEDSEATAESNTGTEEASSEAGKSSSEAAKMVDVSLDPIDQAGIVSRVEELKGSVVLIDFWATWCKPCKEKFPEVVKLSNEHQEEGLHVMSVCIGNPNDEKVREQASTFLTKVKASIENRMSGYEKDQDAFNDYELEQVPSYRLYDREGKLVDQFEILDDEAKQKVLDLLAAE